MPVPPKPRRPALTEDLQREMMALLVWLRHIPKRDKPIEVQNVQGWLEDLAQYRSEVEDHNEIIAMKNSLKIS
jgi:hypothetical protein